MSVLVIAEDVQIDTDKVIPGKKTRTNVGNEIFTNLFYSSIFNFEHDSRVLVSSSCSKKRRKRRNKKRLFFGIESFN